MNCSAFDTCSSEIVYSALSTGEVTTYFGLISLSIVTNMYGTWCLFLHEGMMKKKNFLASLSMSDLMISLYHLVCLLTGNLDQGELHPSYNHFYNLVYLGFSLTRNISFLFIVGERFASIVIPLTYGTVHPSSVRKLVVFGWIVSFVVAAITSSCGGKEIRVLTSTAVVFQGIASLSFILTFVAFTRILKPMQCYFTTNVRRDDSANRKHIFVLMVTFVTSLLCYQLPEYLSMSHHSTLKRTLNLLGLVLDPIMYIFVSSDVRQTSEYVLRNVCFCCRWSHASTYSHRSVIHHQQQQCDQAEWLVMAEDLNEVDFTGTQEQCDTSATDEDDSSWAEIQKPMKTTNRSSSYDKSSESNVGKNKTRCRSQTLR